MGRPPEPVPEDIADEILSWIYEGNSLTSYSKQPGKPKLRTIYGWCEKDETFRAQFTRAREAGAESLVELAQDVANDGLNDTQVDEEGRVIVNHDVVQRSKLRVETLLKRAACFCPRRFGTKASLEHSGKLSLDAIIGQTLGVEPSPEGSE